MPEDAVRRFLARPWVRAVAVALLVGLAIAFLVLVRHLLVPFFIGLAIAYLLDPVVSWLERHRVSRAMGIVLILVALLLVVALVALYVVPRASDAVANFARTVPSRLSGLRQSLEPRWRALDLRYHDRIEWAEQKLRATLETNLPKMLEPIQNAVRRALSSFVNFFVSLVSVIFVPVFAFYLLKDIHRVKRLAVDLLPPRYRDAVIGSVREVDAVISAFLHGQLTVATILAVIYSIGLSVIGVPGSVLLGVFCGYANLVPYLGIATGIPLASLLAFLDAQSFIPVLWVWALFAFAQLLEGTLISPYVVGEKVGLHPVVMILALMIWGDFFGFLGLLVAVPATAAMSVFVRAGYRRYRESDFYRREAAR